MLAPNNAQAKWSGSEIQEIFAPSYIYYKGKLIHFPITPTNMLSKLELGTLIKAVFHLFLDKYIARIHTWYGMRSWRAARYLASSAP